MAWHGCGTVPEYHPASMEQPVRYQQTLNHVVQYQLLTTLLARTQNSPSLRNMSSVEWLRQKCAPGPRAMAFPGVRCTHVRFSTYTYPQLASSRQHGWMSPLCTHTITKPRGHSRGMGSACSLRAGRRGAGGHAKTPGQVCGR